jgi:hypothetical protein
VIEGRPVGGPFGHGIGAKEIALLTCGLAAVLYPVLLLACSA